MTERPWHQHYPAGVPRSIEPLRYESLVDLVDDACERFGPRRAFGNFGSYLSFSSVNANSIRFAAYLQRHCAVEPGTRVAIMLPNVLAYPIVMIGALRAGAVVVNVNPQYTVRELHHQLRDSGASVVVVLRHLLTTLQRAVERTDVRYIISAEVGDLFPKIKRTLVNHLVRRATPDPRRDAVALSVPLTSALGRGAKMTLKPVSISAHDLAFLQYTGGTTGISKGAMLSHRNIVANVSQLTSFFTDHVDPDGDIVITALPLYHIFALTFNCFGFMSNGGLNYLITDPRNVQQFVKELKRVPFNTINGVNTLFNALLAEPSIRDVDFSNLKYSGGGGTATQATTAARWQALTGTVIAEGYGLTEASPAVCANPVGLDSFTGTVGFPLPSTDCTIRDDHGNDLEFDNAGELWVKGPQVMRGYWRAADETAAVLTEDGWLKTGDIAVMNRDGRIRIVDRKKDLIVVSGFNVYPNEIEEVATMHPLVHEAAAIGLPDERTGESVKLVAVSGEPHLDPEELIAFCRERLAAYKVPKSIEFVTELPKSNVGKVLRQAVRNRHGADASQ